MFMVINLSAVDEVTNDIRKSVQQDRPIPSKVELHAIQSDIIDKEVPFFVSLLPPSYGVDDQASFPVVYHLHHNGTHYSFFDWLRIRGPKDKETGERPTQVEGSEWLYFMMEEGFVHEAIYVIPLSPDNVWNSVMGEVLVSEILPYVDTAWRTRANRSQRMIQGISMGGAGALLYGPTYHREVWRGIVHNWLCAQEGILAEFEKGVGKYTYSHGSRRAIHLTVQTIMLSLRHGWREMK